MKAQYQSIKTLVSRIIERLSMASGSSVQIYAEDRIVQMILDQYDLVVDSFAWSNLHMWKDFTLTGIQGLCAENISDSIKNFEDILYISIKDDPEQRLKRLHSSSNPASINGTTPVYYMLSSVPEKLIQIVPFNATGSISIAYKSKLNTNADIKATDIVPFDSSYLVFAVCADYLADDGSSKTQLEKFTNLRDQRLGMLKSLDNQGSFDYNDDICYNSVSDWR